MTMDSAWRPEFVESDNTYGDPLAGVPRSTLGQFIERSTSAPLPSSVEDERKNPSDHALVGNDLLEQLGRGFPDTLHSQAATPLIGNVSSNNHGAVHRDLGSELFPGSSGNVSGRQTAPTTHLQTSFDISRPLSASGGGGEPGLTGGAFDAGLDFGRLGESMVRSRSAQPSLHDAVRPPPGLASNRSSNRSPFASSTSAIGLGIQRPASAGLLGSHQQKSALKPSAKTWMDLIQEDFPGEQQRGQSYEQQQQIEESLEHQSTSPAIARQSRQFAAPSPRLAYGERAKTQDLQNRHFGGAYENQQQADFQPQAPTLQQPQTRFANDLGRHAAPSGEMQRQVYTSMQQQPQVQQMEMQLPLYQQQQQQQQQQRYMGEMGRRQSPIEEPRHVYTTLQHQQPQSQSMAHPQQQPGQQMYYNAPPPQTRVDGGIPMHHQVLQSGQTLYVNAPSPQPGYGYATIQYQTSPTGQQPQIIRQAIPGRGEQFVSVVPIQGSGQQLAYWPAEHQQGMGPVAIVNSSGTVGGPISVARLQENHHHPHQQTQGGGYSGRSSRNADKGGRGKRNPHSRRESSRGGGHSVSSPVLEEFRSSKSRDWTMRQIEGYVLEFCQDQNGSRFIQQRLELGDPVEQQIVMKEVLPAIRRLRNDVFGNYVVQKLLDFGTPEMKSDIRQTLEGEMLQLSLQMYGCRVVQKALEALDEEDLPRVLLEFHHNVLSCIHDQNGNHVIQKCVEVLNNKAKKSEASGDPDRAAFLREQIDFIINDVLVNTVTLSCHPYGCRVLQRILEHCDEQKKVTVLDEIKKCHQKLLDDQYGNYVIQHVLQFGRASDRDSILEIIVQNGLLRLSRQKFASNVVEKLLKHGNGQQRRAVAREMLKICDGRAPSSEPGDHGKSVVILMVRDAYANYVVQTTLDVVPESEEKQLLLKELNAHAEDLRNYTFAKHIVTKLATLNNNS